MANAGRRQLLWAGLGIVVLGVAGLTAAGGLPGFGSGGAYEVKFMTPDQMQADKALVVDVRTPPEWQESGVIEGAKLVTFTDPDSFLAQIKGDLAPGQDLILVCHSGRRSAAAAGALASRIPNHIISIDGGMAAEIANGYRTVAPKM